MSTIYDEIEIEDMEFDGPTRVFTYPCPCGDKFIISLQDLLDGEDVAPCPSCTLRIRIVFDEDYLIKMQETCNTVDNTKGDVQQIEVNS